MADLDDLVTAVLATSKYQHISPDLVRRLGAAELGKRPRLKEAVKATKNKLHQIGGAYFTASIDYEAALAQIADGRRRGPEAEKEALAAVMRRHASTNERLPVLAEFYASTLAGLPPIHSVLDVACGLNPLARPWMPLAEDADYLAYDIYADMMAFLNDYFALAGVPGRAAVRDVAAAPPTEPVDLALLLKTLPVLAQEDKTAVPRLLDTLQARYLLVSFPAQSLGGRQKGMVANYEAQFDQWAAGRNWQVKRFEFASELAFLVKSD